MQLAHPFLSSPIVFRETETQILVVEEPKLLRSFIEQIRSQLDGLDGEFVLSRDHAPIPFKRSVIFVPDVLSPAYPDRALATAIAKYVRQECDAMEQEVAELLTGINGFAARLLPQLELDLTYAPVEDISAVLKLLSFAPDCADRSPIEQLLDFLRIHRTFFGTELFILSHLHAYFSTEEIRSFLGSVLYEKFYLLLLETAQPRQTLDCERLRIIDPDLCEI